MSDKVLVKVENVSKKFCRSLKKSLWYGVQDIAGELFGRDGAKADLRPDEFWALEDVSFELRRGECLGLIGRNGAGKTTLLRLLNGLIKPDKGRIGVRGQVGALIALGAGFNPILTGRENIYVNASVLGISKQRIDRILDEIIDFAEIREFIDTPVQSYSSGMRVRLGFAIAAQLELDILLIDEILAVGDRPFRVKCFNRIAELQATSGTVLVSHSMPHIARVCTSVAVLDHGRLVFIGDVTKGVRIYDSLGSSNEESFVKTTGGVHFDHISIGKTHISWNDDLPFRVEFTSEVAIDDCIARVLILNHYAEVIAEWKSRNHGKTYRIVKGRNTIADCIAQLKLRSGRYYLSFVLSPFDEVAYLIGAHLMASFEVKEGMFGNVFYQA